MKMVFSAVLSSMLFLILFVFSLHMDEAFGAHDTEIRKLKETVTTRRSLEGDEQRGSKMYIGPSRTRRCGIGRTFKNMATTYRPDGHDHAQFLPLQGGYYSPSPCSPCVSQFSYCSTYRCTKITRCQSFYGSPMSCTTSENCVPGH